MTRPAAASRSARAFVLIAVLVIVAAAIFVATGAIFAARGASVSSRAADLERRLRDAALDGVAIAADGLAAQRLALLQGAAPDADERLLDVPDGPRSFSVRLVPQGNGEFFESEAAKLDLRDLTVEAADAISAGQPEAARALLEAAVGGGARTSVEGLVARTASVVPSEALDAMLGGGSLLGDERDAREESLGAARESSPPPLVSLLTAHGAEPLVDDLGVARLDLVAAFGNEAGEQIATASLDLFEDAEREALESVVRDGKRRADDGAIVAALVGRGVSLERIDAIMNECTTESGTHGTPRVDIVRADIRVLSAVRGLGADAAARIVDLRSTLEDEERRGTGWLVSRRVLSIEEYAAVAGRLTHRSALWRFRVEARLAAADERADRVGASEPEPRGVYAYDCIVDVSRPDPRIVFLRDVTMLPTVRAIAAITRSGADREAGRSSSDDGAGSVAIFDESEPESDRPVSSELDAPRPPARPQPGFRAPRFDLPPKDATIPSPPSRGRTSPNGRDIAAPPPPRM